MTKAEQNNTTPLIYELVDIAILPAALLICAKAIGMAILNAYFGLNWNLEMIANGVFSVRPVYTTQADAMMVSSFTNFFMFICVLAGSMMISSKSMIFHHRKASPRFVLKLAKYDLLHLLKSSFHIYKEAFIWGTFLILTTVYILISFLNETTYGWIAGVSILFCLTFLWMMIDNIEEDLLFHNYK